MKIRVVFFDLDDTLFPAEAVYQLGLRAAWQELRKSKPMSWVAFERLYQRARNDVRQRLGSDPSIRNRILYFKRMSELLLGRPRPALVLALMRAYHTCWRHIDGASLRPLLARLSKRYTLGVLTNQVTGFQLEKLNRIDPHGKYLTHLLTSEEVGCEKPDVRFFKQACRDAGCRPAEAVMVGDSWDSDIRGALKVGMRAIYVNNAPPTKALPRGVLHVRHLTQVEDALDAFLA